MQFAPLAKSRHAGSGCDCAREAHPAEMQGVTRSILESALAIACRQRLHKRSPAGAPHEPQSDAVVEPGAELPVLGAPALIERTGTAKLVQLLRIKLGFPMEVFQSAVSPVIEGYAEFAQLLPAPQSQRHADPGGLFTRSLEVASRALDYRRGQILPRGAAPEVIGAEAHRWTYAVFVAALLHDVGRTLAELRVLMRTARDVPELWAPVAGSMSAQAGVSYRVELAETETQRDELHRTLPVQLLNRFVPALVVEWLARDPELVRELRAFLSGRDSARTGAISTLVLRAASGRGRRGDLPTRGEDDPAAEPTAPAASTDGVTSGHGFDAPAAIPDTTARVPSVAMDLPLLPGEGVEYLEDFEQRGREPATAGQRDDVEREAAALSGSASPPSQSPSMADPWWAQASDAARRFMGWVRQGISDGTLRVNEAGALVHFVDEGMLLVSPRIFREFAKGFGETGCGNAPAIGALERDIGMPIQRELLRAGWHLHADNGVNFLTYQVMWRKRAVSRLSGIVIGNPARFVNPVPPVNPVLARLSAGPGDA